jgi:hypothetical protein
MLLFVLAGGRLGDRPCPVAAGWDNTMIKNDIGDAMFWMIKHDKIRQPAGANWRTTSPFMTEAGAVALLAACGAGTRRGCGDVPDGTNDGAGHFTGNSLITYIDGKRCWINQAIFGDNTVSATLENPDPSRRQVFAAGDSNTDVTFLRDATAMALVLNRNKAELMCNAFWDRGGQPGKRWLVNPMFIAPKAHKTSPYRCSATACFDSSGAPKPCVDEDGFAIPDQADTVY